MVNLSFILLYLGYYYLYDLTKILNAGPPKATGKGPGSFFIPSLSDKEKIIIGLIRQELTGREIAEKLNLHIKTIEMHKRNIIEKSNCKKMLGAIDFLISNKVIPMQNAS